MLSSARQGMQAGDRTRRSPDAEGKTSDSTRLEPRFGDTEEAGAGRLSSAVCRLPSGVVRWRMTGARSRHHHMKARGWRLPRTGPRARSSARGWCASPSRDAMTDLGARQGRLIAGKSRTWRPGAGWRRHGAGGGRSAFPSPPQIPHARRGIARIGRAPVPTRSRCPGRDLPRSPKRSFRKNRATPVRRSRFELFRSAFSVRNSRRRRHPISSTGPKGQSSRV